MELVAESAFVTRTIMRLWWAYEITYWHFDESSRSPYKFNIGYTDSITAPTFYYGTYYGGSNAIVNTHPEPRLSFYDNKGSPVMLKLYFDNALIEQLW